LFSHSQIHKQTNKHYLQIYHIRTWHLAEEARLHGAIDVHRPLEPRLVPRLLAHLQPDIRNHTSIMETAKFRHHCQGKQSSQQNRGAQIGAEVGTEGTASLQIDAKWSSHFQSTRIREK
jgi:hypothetical protein